MYFSTYQVLDFLFETLDFFGFVVDFVKRYANAKHELDTTNKGPLMDRTIQDAQIFLTIHFEAGSWQELN